MAAVRLEAAREVAVLLGVAADDVARRYVFVGGVDLDDVVLERGAIGSGDSAGREARGHGSGAAGVRAGLGEAAAKQERPATILKCRWKRLAVIRTPPRTASGMFLPA